MANTFFVGEKGGRPWGEWEVIYTSDNYIVKRVQVNPGQAISLQSHAKRKEIWNIVEAEDVEITLESTLSYAKPGDIFSIPEKTKHRIINKGSTPLVFIEVQIGNHLDEADTTRFENVYSK